MTGATVRRGEEVGEGGIVDVEFPPYEERTGVMIRRREPGEASR